MLNQYNFIQAIINKKPIEHNDWAFMAKEYLELRAELIKLQTITGFKKTLNARERIQYLRKLSQDFQFTDAGRLTVHFLSENDWEYG